MSVIVLTALTALGAVFLGILLAFGILVWRAVRDQASGPVTKADDEAQCAWLREYNEKQNEREGS